MTRSGLDEFKGIMADFRHVSSLALKGVVAVPLADIWAKMGPPPNDALPVLLSITELVALIWVFHFWHELSSAKLKRRMRFSLLAFCLGSIVSLALLGTFTVSRGKGVDRIVAGFQVRSDVRPLLGSNYTTLDALKDTESPEDVWTGFSINVTRFVIQIVWIFTFAALAVYIGVFVMAQRREPSQVTGRGPPRSTRRIS
jgi:hypothetical protein